MDLPSFVEPAKPVFFKFRRPPCINPDIAKKLSFRDENGPLSRSSDSLKVYLRIKPNLGNASKSFVPEDDHTLVRRMPDRNEKGKNLVKCRYSFTKIFFEDAHQGEVFSGTVRSSLRPFLYGSNYLLFSYGTTCSGKTYTLIGTASDPGIIPRVLISVFKSIEGREDFSGTLCPNRGCSVTLLPKDVVKENEDFKRKIFEFNKEKLTISSMKSFKSSSSAHSSCETFCDYSYDDLQQSLLNDVEVVSLPSEVGVVYSIWVSFAEIYNENIYDLLEPYESGRPRKVLKIAFDKERGTYIKDLHHVHVTSFTEAFNVLMFGKRNLSISATAMNKQSSRSHSIFSVKLLKRISDSDEAFIRVSSLTLCDLAGSERQRSALNTGARLKESGNINSSLLVLNRCFNVIRDNQLRADKQVVPFRDSKLTQLFQRALLGKDIMSMIVTINQSMELLEETQHILKSSAIAFDIKIDRGPRSQNPKKPRFSVLCTTYSNAPSIPWLENGSTSTTIDNLSKETTQDIENLTCQSDLHSVPELLALVDSLQTQLAKCKEKVKEEVKKSKVNVINERKEVSTEYMKLMKEMEIDYKKRIEHLEMKNRNIVKHYTKQVDSLSKKRKPSDSDEEEERTDDKSSLLKRISILGLDLESTQRMYKTATDEIKRLQKANTMLHIKVSDLEREKVKMSNLIEEKDTTGIIKCLEEDNLDKGKKIEALEGLLDEAREEFTYLTNTVKELESELTEKDQEIASKYTLIEELELKERELNGTIECLRLQLIEMKHARETRAIDNNLAQEFHKLSVENKETKEAFEKLKQDKTKVEEQLVELKLKYEKQVGSPKVGDIIKIHQDVNQSPHSRKSVEKQREITFLEDGEATLQKEAKLHEINSLTEELKMKNAEIVNLKRLNLDVQVNNEELLEELKSLKEEFKKRGEEISSLKLSLGEVESLKEALQTAVKEKKKATEELNQLKDNVQERENDTLTFKQFQEEIESLKKDLQYAIEEKRKAGEELNSLREELQKREELTLKLKHFQEESELLKKDLISAIEEKSKAGEELNSLREELQKREELTLKLKHFQEESESLKKELLSAIEEKSNVVEEYKNLEESWKTKENEFLKESSEINKVLEDLKTHNGWESREKDLKKEIGEKSGTVEELKILLKSHESKENELKKAIEEKEKVVKEFQLLLRERDSKQDAFNLAVKEKLEALEQVKILQTEMNAKKQELKKAIDEKNKALEDKKKSDLNLFHMKVSKDLLKTEPKKHRQRKSCAMSDDDKDTYKSFDYEDTDDDIFVPNRTKAATTVKKKKKPTAKKHLEVPSYDINQDQEENVEGTSPVRRSQRMRRKLFMKSHDALEDFSTVEPSDEQLQHSPGTIMKRTLRTGKKF